ncbi:MAG TPA: hypothetical protein VFZ59_06585 [Verrucomicrobiae bacterium]|nr:hypothetical protein [Verrucomicrobiae bacterium]
MGGLIATAVRDVFTNAPVPVRFVEPKTWRKDPDWKTRKRGTKNAMADVLRSEYAKRPPRDVGFQKGVESQMAQRLLFRIALWILGISAGLKLASVWENSPALSGLDPMLGISYRTVMLGGAIVETVVLAVLLLLPNMWLRGIILGGLGAEFVLYHLASPGGGCPCLGSMWHWLGIPDRTMEWISLGLGGWLLLSGLLLLRNDRLKT